MVYLENITSGQTVWIPKNGESGHVHTGSSGSYQEGFEDGYTSGVTDQKNKLSSAIFTQNSSYTSTDGWSSVTVNVPSSGSTPLLEEKTVIISADTTSVTPNQGYDGLSSVTIDATDYVQSNYDSGFDDGFLDGYSSGFSDGSSGCQLTETAVTVNGRYEGMFSAFTVNVPTSGIGEFYCLYCENASFNLGGALGNGTEFEQLSASILPLSNLNIIIKGGTTDYPYDCDELLKFHWSGNTSSYKFYESNYRNASWNYSTTSSTHTTKTFPSFHSLGLSRLSSDVAYVDYSTVTGTRAVRILNTCGVIISGATYYLGSVNVNNGYCNITPTVDNNGLGCMYYNGNYYYPTSGNAYPVYRYKLNGSYRYYIANVIQTT